MIDECTHTQTNSKSDRFVLRFTSVPEKQRKETHTKHTELSLLRIDMYANKTKMSSSRTLNVVKAHNR